MGDVSVWFLMETEPELVARVAQIMEAINEAGFYGFESKLHEEAGDLELYVEDINQVSVVCGWMAILKRVLCEIGLQSFSITVQGATDNGHESYTAFQICCDQEEIKMREKGFTCAIYEENDYDLIEYEAISELDKMEYAEVDDGQLHYHENEYKAALVASR